MYSFSDTKTQNDFRDFFQEKFGDYGIYYIPFVFKEHKKKRKLVYLNHKTHRRMRKVV